MLHREQSLGETRGLRRAQQLIDDRRIELQEKLGVSSTPKPDPKQHTPDLPL